MTTPDRIAICQHPNGEGLYVSLKAGERCDTCFQDCDCTPRIYVAMDALASFKWAAPAAGKGRRGDLPT